MIGDGSDWTAAGYLLAAAVTFVIALRRFVRDDLDKPPGKRDGLGLDSIAAVGAAAFWPLIVVCWCGLQLARLLTRDLR